MSHVPTSIPQVDDEENVEDEDTKSLHSMQGSKKLVAKGLAVVVIFTVVCTVVLFLILDDKVDSIDGQFIVQLNAAYFPNQSAVAYWVEDMDQAGVFTEDDFTLLHLYSNLNGLGSPSLSVKMSASMHSTLLHDTGILSIEPDLHVYVTDNSHVGVEGCTQQANPTW